MLCYCHAHSTTHPAGHIGVTEIRSSSLSSGTSLTSWRIRCNLKWSLVITLIIKSIVSSTSLLHYSIHVLQYCKHLKLWGREEALGRGFYLNIQSVFTNVRHEEDLTKLMSNILSSKYGVWRGACFHVNISSLYFVCVYIHVRVLYNVHMCTSITTVQSGTSL